MRIFVLLHFLTAIVALKRCRKLRLADCECGIQNHDTVKVLPWGIFSENHAWPWMASIVNTTILGEPEAYCGGTLINDRYILTAAHCIPDMMTTGVQNFKIYVGTNYILNASDFLGLDIQSIISHPSFNFDTADSDVSLIKLSQPVTFSDHIRPVCLRQNGRPFVGDTAYITGWGSFNLTEHTENSLKEAKAVVVSNDACSKKYSSEDIPITENMICASVGNISDPCKGDSGGPLLVKENSGKGAFSQIGIISHGEGCAVPDYPSIFSRVSSFIKWIKTNTRDAAYCPGTFSS